tara:strand:+ start:59 stop:598 length:540 start_codon:yes stop_codon:yes gene_type:complete
MQKIKDIQTPKTLEQFRVNLKKFCLGSEDNIFIFNKADGKDYKVDIEKISKISDVINLISVMDNKEIFLDDVSIVLMCDVSHIKTRELMNKKEDAIMSLKEVYLFNNQDSYERNNFLNSTPHAIGIIQSGGKINGEKDSRPAQTSIISPYFNGLFAHLFGEYFDTAYTSEKEYHLSKYH